MELEKARGWCSCIERPATPPRPTTIPIDAGQSPPRAMRLSTLQAVAPPTFRVNASLGEFFGTVQ